jgi:hypothetical protein
VIAKKVVDSNKPDEVENPPKINSSNIAESNFFTFEIHQCRQSGTTVSCDLSITNKDNMDKILKFEWNSNGRVFDELGNQGTMFDWMIANKSGLGAKPLLLPNVPVKANLKFKNVSGSSKILKRMDLALTTRFREGGSYKTRDFVVKFENIKLQ